jgi:hypothetical protein
MTRILEPLGASAGAGGGGAGGGGGDGSDGDGSDGDGSDGDGDGGAITGRCRKTSSAAVPVDDETVSMIRRRCGSAAEGAASHMEELERQQEQHRQQAAIDAKLFRRCSLSHADTEGNVDLVKHLLSSKRANPEGHTDVHGRTALYWARAQRHEELTALLQDASRTVEAAAGLACGAPPTTTPPPPTPPPPTPPQQQSEPTKQLFRAVARDEVEVVQELLAAGEADVTATNKAGLTPLGVAKERGRRGSAQLLVAHQEQ